MADATELRMIDVDALGRGFAVLSYLLLYFTACNRFYVSLLRPDLPYFDFRRMRSHGCLLSANLTYASVVLVTVLSVLLTSGGVLFVSMLSADMRHCSYAECCVSVHHRAAPLVNSNPRCMET